MKYVVSILLHVTVEAPTRQVAEREVWAKADQLKTSGTVTAVTVVRQAP